MTELIAGTSADADGAYKGTVLHDTRRSPMWLKPLEAASALLMINITVLLLVGVISRYLFNKSLVWSDEVVSISFIWLTMLGAAIAVHRNEHLRLGLFVDLLPPRLREFVNAFALVAIAALLLALIGPAIDYAKDEWFIHTPALDLPNTFRVSSIAFGFAVMLALIVLYAGRSARKLDLVLAVLVVGAVELACWHF